jgi:hypothetical protein
MLSLLQFSRVEIPEFWSGFGEFLLYLESGFAILGVRLEIFCIRYVAYHIYRWIRGRIIFFCCRECQGTIA